MWVNVLQKDMLPFSLWAMFVRAIANTVLLQKEYLCRVDDNEPQKIARAINNLKLSYVVVTSVTRDDLNDGGALYFAKTVDAVRTLNDSTKVEVLIPDFKHSQQLSLKTIMAAKPDVINHNIEVAQSCYTTLRPKGNYRASLKLLAIVTEYGFTAKSGLMIGFGETLDDIVQTLRDVRSTGCEIMTIGQYRSSHKGAYPHKNIIRRMSFHGLKQ